MIPILYLSHCGSDIGGGEKQLFNLVTNLDRACYHPLVVCPDDGIFAEQLRGAEIPTTILHLPQWRKATSLITRRHATKKLIEYVKKHNVEIIHTSDSWFNPYILEVKKHLNLLVISHVRNILNTSQVTKYGFDRMDYIITISDEYRLHLIECGVDKAKIDVILNCVDTSLFHPKDKMQDSRSNPFVVGIVGRIEPFKQQKEFVEITSKVYQQSQDVHFHIIGGVLDSPEHRQYESEVRKMVSNYGLEDVIDLVGYRNDMPCAMQELDVLVTLSAGSVIAEAMASGKPVIGTKIGSTADMIVDDKMGWVIPSDAVSSVVDRIVQLVSDRELCEQMGVAARKHAVETFSIETHVQKVQNVYEKLLDMP